MSIRVVKHIGARSCPADDAKVLHLVPLFPGEKLVSARLSAYFASGDDGSVDQPGEVNWYGLSIPWQTVFTTNMISGGGAPSVMATVAEYDDLYRRWLKGGDDEYYGGDVDADPEVISGEEGHVTEGAAAEELIESGPIGVSKWFSREVVMQPFAAEGNNVIRFGDSFTAGGLSAKVAAMGSLLIFGIVRFEHAAETNFNIELDDAVSKEAMGLLLSGDYTKVGAKVEGDTGSLGDFLRTVLYGGDYYAEADTIKGPAGKAVVKGKYVISTSMGRKH